MHGAVSPGSYMRVPAHVSLMSGVNEQLSMSLAALWVCNVTKDQVFSIFPSSTHWHMPHGCKVTALAETSHPFMASRSRKETGRTWD